MSARPLLALLAPAIASACLLGCGGGSAESTQDADTTRAAGPRAVPRALTVRQAVELANAVNLRAADVPYFEERPEEPESEEDAGLERRLKRDFGRCLGGVDLFDRVVEYQSPTYGSTGPNGILTVESTVEVAPSAALTARRAEAYRSSRGQSCFRRLLIPLFEEEGSTEVEIGEATITRLPPPLPEVEGSFGYRISTSATYTGAESQLTAHRPGMETASPQRTIPFHVDLLAFTVGPVEVDLVATGAPTPVAKNFERNLLAVLHERALVNLP